jgi:hypothetical protein
VGSISVDEKNDKPGMTAIKPLATKKGATKAVSVGDLIDFTGGTSLDDKGIKEGDLFEFDGFHEMEPDLGLLEFTDLMYVDQLNRDLL